MEEAEAQYVLSMKSSFILFISQNVCSVIIVGTPYRSLPMLQYEGLILAQSMTIARFLAKKVAYCSMHIALVRDTPAPVVRSLISQAGLGGQGDMEQAQADMIVDSVNDVQACKKNFKVCQALHLDSSSAIMVLSVTSKIRFAKDKGERSVLAKNFVETILPGFLSLNEAILAERGGMHFAGNTVCMREQY